MVMKRLGTRWQAWLGGVLFALLSACSSQMAPESNFVLLDLMMIQNSLLWICILKLMLVLNLLMKIKLKKS